MPVKESQIVTAICNYLQMLENMNKLYFIRNNTGAFAVQPVGGNRRFMRFGKSGSSDIIIYLPEGRTVFVEVKREGGKQNQNQHLFEAKIKLLGFEYYVVTDIDEVKNIILERSKQWKPEKLQS